MTRKDSKTPKDPRHGGDDTQPGRGQARKSDGHEADTGAEGTDESRNSTSPESTSAIVRPPNRPY